MRLSRKKSLILAVFAVLIGGFVVYRIFSIRNSASQTLAEERARLLEKNRVPFEKKVLTPHLSGKIRILQNARDTRDFVRFKDSYFAATGGGLAQFDENGKTLKHFTVLDGLPESDLTALIVYQNKLYIGTRTKNLVAFDGAKFENYVWTDRRAQAVTSFLESDGRLLIGTFAGGLLEFDGDSFAEIKAEKTRISAINRLHKNGAEIFVGTFDNGLWISKSGVWAHFTTAENLSSNRVVGIVSKDDDLYVATDFGLAIREDETFRSLAVLPTLSGLARRGNRLFLAKDDGEIFTFESDLKNFSAEENVQNARLTTSGDCLFLLSSDGISEIDGAKTKLFSRAPTESLTDNFVSALAFDRHQNLWIGAFRSGIDVFSVDGEKLRHIESENVREINFLQANGDGVFAAASGGLLKFKNDFSAETTTKKDGLPSDSVTHFSGDFTATARGLAFRQNGKIRVLSTVQGLPNNSVYATLRVGGKLYAGTLGGLAEIENGRVTRVWKDSNSNLQTNWTTSLIYTNERLFIGTYGGGIFELLPSGEIRSFAADAGKFVVNPNALYSDGERLYAGTLEGVKILDLQTQRWEILKSVLPAETVMSITGDGENIYFGTTGGVARMEKSYFTGEESE